MKLLSIFLLTILPKVHCDRRDIKQTLQDSIWNKFQLNIQEYFIHTKEFSIIDIVSNKSPKPDQRESVNILMKYFSVVKNIPIFNFLWYLHYNYNKAEYNTLKHFFERKQVIFISFETVFQMNKSLSDNFWTIITSTKSSFIVLIADGNFNETCDHNFNFLVTANYIFKTLWIGFNMLEVLIIIPDKCKNQIDVYKYNILDNSSKVLVNKEKLLHDYENFQGYPLKVSVFEKMPTFMTKKSELFICPYMNDDVESIGGAIGMDAFIMANIINKLNFTPYIFVSRRDDYGYRNDDGSFTGSLKTVIEKEVDISFNSRFLTYYDTDSIEFTNFIYYDEFCVLTPKAQEIPNWMKILSIFDYVCWIFMIFTILISIFVWKLMNFNINIEKVNRKKPLDVVRLILNNPMPSLPKDLKGRILIGCILISNLIILGIFQVFINRY